MAHESACPSCGASHPAAAIAAAFKTCPSCGYHYRMEPAERLDYLVDPASFEECSGTLRSRNPIGMTGYTEKIAETTAASGLYDAIITGTATLGGRPLILGFMSFSFLGGSMGSVVGEKVCRAFLAGAQQRLPVVIFATSGGARMQEGIFSLLQMAKTASAAAELDKAGVPLFIVLCDPTTGGVTASFAMLADVTLAEPGALIGFAGPRVIEGTIRESLPDGFQRAEFQLRKGFVDCIVPRQDQRQVLGTLLDLHGFGAAPVPGKTA